MLEQLKELKKKREEAYDKFREAYDEACNEFNTKVLELLPYEGKCVKIYDDTFHCVPHYIKVREVFQHGNNFIIRGYGFAGEFTNYADATWFEWDYMHKYDFSIDQIEQKVKCIKIIGEQEFTKAFNELVNKIRYNHLNTML